MKKALSLFFALLAIFAFIVTLTACGGIDNFEISFIVDGETYQTIFTNGTETVSIPENPTKEGYTFDGWYWDLDVWEKPFTANSLLDAPISSDMSVYAKWSLINPPCSHRDADDNLICDECGEEHDDGVEVKKYTVTFETNGGTTIAPLKTNVIENSPLATKDYNTFVAWYSDASMQESTRVSFPFAITSDITLYAKWSVDFTEGLQLTLQTSTNTYFVTGYTGTESVVIIPSTYKGLDVTGINARAFEGNSMIADVVIPDSVITVGLGAFSECYNLLTVEMGNNLQLLGASAFSNCIKLKSINLPDTLQNIGGEAFFGCTAIEELYLSNELVNIGTNIIRGCNSLKKLTLPGRITLISLVGDTNDNIPTGLTEIVFANGSQSICGNALHNCTQINIITVPDSVTEVGFGAFSGCTSLRRLTVPFIGASLGGTDNTHFGYVFGAASYTENGSAVPDSLKTVVITVAENVDDNAFYGCDSISDIYFPISITSFGLSAFEGCEGLCGVYVSDLSIWCAIDFENEKANPLYYANKLYVDNVLITDLTIPDNVIEIKPYAFYNCELESIYIPSSVQICGFSTFGGCNTIESITLPFVGNSRDVIENTHFGYIFGASVCAYNYDCVPKTLRTVVITDTTVIEENAFYKCTSLTEITIPDSVLQIKKCAFHLCSGIKVFDISSNIMSIGEGAFAACTDLTEIRVSEQNKNYKVIDSVLYTIDGEMLVQYLPSKTETIFNIPETVLTICDYAFASCANLEFVNIPSNTSSIGEYAFVGCTKITNLRVPSTVLSIGYGAFLGCSNLESLSLPFVGKTADGASNTHFGYIFGAQSYTVNAGNVPANLKSIEVFDGTSISDFAFYGCSNIKNITIADSVKSIGIGAFEGCTGLEKITLPFVGKTGYGTSNTHFGYVFGAASYNENSSFVPNNLHSVVITGGTTIYDSAFRGCSGIYEVVISDSITRIDKNAFLECSSINKMTLPFVGNTKNSTGLESHLGYIFGYRRDTSWISHHLTFEEEYGTAYYKYYIPATLRTVVVTEQGNFTEYAFKNCAYLHHISLPNSTESFCSGAIEGCTSLSYNQSNNGKYLGSIDNPYIVLVGMVNADVAEFTISDTTKIICDYAFKDSSLGSITVPNNVEKIGEGAFNGCDRLHIMTLPFIGESGDAVGFKSHFGYIFGYYVTSSEPSHYHYFGAEYANGQWNKCYYTYNFPTSFHVNISNGITSIASQAFNGCVNLQTVVIPDSVTSIAYSAFSGCTELYSVTMSKNITSIGDYAFEDCLKLKSITIPDNVTSIGNSAFSGCKGLTDITIPDGVTSIGNSAFYYCTSLTSVTIPDSVTTIGNSAFSGCSGLTDITIPDGVTSIGNSAFSYCTSLTSVTIPDSVTTIGWSAFMDCTNLTIYCEAPSQPEGWASNWNASYCPVVWGVTKEE